MISLLSSPQPEDVPGSSDLSEPALGAFEDLVKANLVCAGSVREAGSATALIPLGTHFEGIARRRVSAARELRVHLEEKGSLGPVGGPSLLFTLGLLWDHLKLVIQGGQSLVVIRYVSRASEELERAYRAALSRRAGCPLDGVCVAHLRQLRAEAETLRWLESLLTRSAGGKAQGSRKPGQKQLEH